MSVESQRELDMRALEIAKRAETLNESTQMMLLRHFDECGPRQAEILRRFDKQTEQRDLLRQEFTNSILETSKVYRTDIGKIYAMLWVVAGALIMILLGIIGFLYEQRGQG